MKKVSMMVASVLSGLMLSVTAQAADLQIKGSDTLINLVQRLAEEYMAKGGEPISVTGGGSGTGIAALINKKCDIADASRLMKGKEIDQAKNAGVVPKRVVVAMDGLSVIINSANPVSQLTKQQIGAIYRGEVTNWAEVGGPDQAITLYGRQSNSGTFVYFMDEVLKGDYSARMNRMNGNAQIVEAVRNDASGIGYVGVGYVQADRNGLTVLKIAAREGGEYASPLNEADVASGKYPLARPLQQYVNGTPKGLTADFIAFELSAEGQQIVEEEGFFAIPQEYIDFNQQSVGL